MFKVTNLEGLLHFINERCFQKMLAVFTKASVCAMIIWYLRRSCNRGLSEGLLLKVKICYSFKKLFFCPVNFISEGGIHCCLLSF